MIKLSDYKNVFGAPNDGVHSVRLFNIAIIDFVLTLLGAFVLSYSFTQKTKNDDKNTTIYYCNLLKNFIYNSIILLIIGIVFHRLFSVNTTLNVLIFGNIN